MRQWDRILSTILVLFAGQWTFADTPKKDSKPPAQEQYQNIIREHDKAMEDYRRAAQAAQTRDEQQKVLNELYPFGERYLDRFLAIAENNPKDPVAVDSLVWVLRNARGKDREKLRRAEAKAMDLVIRRYLDDERITKPFFLFVYEVYNPNIEQFLRTVLEKSPNRVVRGVACFCLARHLNQLAISVRFVKKVPKNAELREIAWGKDTVKRFLGMDPELLESESEKLLEVVIAKYGDVKIEGDKRGTLEEQAGSVLFEIRHLTIGKPAPDIEGEDIDGKRFKLSDYRGKVVVLDFWGHW